MGPPASEVYQPGTATWGNDIPGAHFVTDSWQACQKACDEQIGCVVWKLDAMGCYLKRSPAQAAFRTGLGR